MNNQVKTMILKRLLYKNRMIIKMFKMMKK